MFLPINKQDMIDRNWDEVDFIYVSGEAYVDHPSFGHSIVSRLFESYGYKVGMISLPNINNADAFKVFGRPKYAFLVSSGVVDSMVNHYTASKKRRHNDEYAPGNKAGLRPDRATTVYTNKLKEIYSDVPVIIGGIEASLRRFAHYDYWADKVMQSIIVDSKADLLIYGMGEKPIHDIVARIEKGIPVNKIRDVRGTVYCDKLENLSNEVKNAINDNTNNDKVEVLHSYEEVNSDKVKYAECFKVQIDNQDSITGKTLIQNHGKKYVIQNPPQLPLTQKEMDRVYALKYERTYHPIYEKDGGVPAIKEVEFSITSHRGCYGNCNFCALTFHQGRVIQNRSQASIIQEATAFTHNPNFKGYIHDVGGPSANFRHVSCEKQIKYGMCKHRGCVFPNKCDKLIVDHSEYLDLLRKVRNIPGIKKVFIRSGIRYDYLMYDKNEEFFKELCKYHISGQLKVAPEHVVDSVLDKMGKPNHNIYMQFASKYKEMNKSVGKDQYLVPYFISSHPGCTLKDSIKLTEYLKSINYMPEQVQDFYPTPSTVATCMYYTGIDPRNMQKVYVPRSEEDKKMQRALLQYRKKENYWIIKKALIMAGREDLIGFKENCIIKPTKDEAKKNLKLDNGNKKSTINKNKYEKSRKIEIKNKRGTKNIDRRKHR